MTYLFCAGYVEFTLHTPYGNPYYGILDLSGLILHTPKLTKSECNLVLFYS